MKQASTPTLIFRCVALLYCIIMMQQTSAQDSTRFGAMINGDMSVPSKIAIINSLGAKYTRTAITLQNWSGSDLAYEKYREAGINVALNINWYSHNLYGAPVPFPTNLVLYKNTLTAVLNKYPDPAIVVIENEETQKEYHSGAMNNYVAELYAAIPIVHGKGLKVTNGGIHPQGLCYWVWKDYIDRDLPDSAAWWKTTTFSPQMNGGVSNPTASINFYWRQIDTLLRAYDTLDLDYVNMHYYEPINSAGDGVAVTGNAIKIIADYVWRRTGKRTMTNETGQENEDPVLVTNMLAAYAAAKYPFVIWWSGDGSSARALNQSTGVLRDNGNAYRSFVAHYADTLGKSTGNQGSNSNDNSVTDPSIVPYEIIADRLDIKGRNGKQAQLVIKNSTQNIKGFLYNMDSGFTKFKVGIDSMWFPGDTIKVRYSDGTVVAKVVTAEAGATTLQQAYDGSVTAGQTNPTVNTSAAGVYFRGTDVINRLGAQNGTDGTLSLLAADGLNKRSYMSAGTTFFYVYPGYYKTNLPTGKGYAAVDVNGDGNITMQPLPTSFAEESSLQWSVLDSIPNPATYTGTIATGDKFLVAAGATGAFVNEDNHIAIYVNPGWDFDTASTGDLLNNANVEGYATNSYVYKFNGSSWQRVSQNFVVNGGSPVPVKVGPKYAHILQFITNNVPRLSFAANGNARWSKLVGTGYRLTQVDANGYFTAIPWTTVRDSIGTGTQGLQAVITNNPALTANNSINSTGYTLTFNGTRFNISMADSITIGSTNKLSLVSLDSLNAYANNLFMRGVQTKVAGSSKVIVAANTTTADSTGIEFKIGSVRMPGLPAKGAGTFTDSLVTIDPVTKQLRYANVTLISLFTRVANGSLGRIYLSQNLADTLQLGTSGANVGAKFYNAGTSNLAGNTQIGYGVVNAAYVLSVNGGLSTSVTRGLDVQFQSSNTSVGYGAYISNIIAAPGASGGTYYGASSVLSTGNNIYTAAPLQSIATYSQFAYGTNQASSVAWTTATGIESNMVFRQNNIKNITNFLHFNATVSASTGNTGVISGDDVGYYKDSVNASLVSGRNIAFWANGASLLSIFDGKVAIGDPASATPADQLYVNGTTKINGVLRLKGYTVATLPAGTVGDYAYVTDASAPTYNATLTGGGATVCVAFYNGTNWTAH